MSTQARNGYPAWRVFIFGQEVTEDVTRCSVTISDDRQPNTAEITLASPGDRYTVTAQDIEAIYDDVNLAGMDLDALTSPHSSSRLGAAPAALNMAGAGSVVSINDSTKASVLGAKIDKLVATDLVEEPVDIDVAAGSETVTVRDLQYLAGVALRYPFQQGDCIFHPHDHVRIFWRNPYEPYEWQHKFAGFVSDTTDTATADGERTVTILCEDPTRVLRYARMTTNPGVIDIDVVKQMTDAVARTFWNDNFFGLTLEEVIYTMIFGSSITGTDAVIRSFGGAIPGTSLFSVMRHSVTGSSQQHGVATDGAGAFNFDRSVTYVFGTDGSPSQPPTRLGPQALSRPLAARRHSLQNLAEYQTDLDVRVQLSDVETMVGPELQPELTANKLKSLDHREAIQKVITELGTKPQLYPVDGQRLVMLIPASLGRLDRSVLLMDIIQSVNLATTFKTRLGTIYDILERVEFSFYATGKGDIVCEMPLYDFGPSDFGDYGSVLTVPVEDTIDMTRTFSESQVRTMFVTGYNAVQNLPSVGTAQQMGLRPVVVAQQALIPAFGVRMEQAEPKGFIASPEAARVYGHIKLNQWNANARTVDASMVPRLRLQPNRPVLFRFRNFIGTVRQVSWELTWNRSFTMRLRVNYIRGWDGSYIKDTKKPNYSPIGGEASRPLNYAALFRRRLVAASAKGKSKLRTSRGGGSEK